eukprot:TRINITY_DN18885_c0_g1_i1.p1 TRINITY_DN18885_c0_g1~~TRINITY_DN18885_c0_g1_i1.p1  ORF type:complete len:194 (-),score=24.03 TRINITY_DN18885_c0_g1_i1:13-549(-)
MFVYLHTDVAEKLMAKRESSQHQPDWECTYKVGEYEGCELWWFMQMVVVQGNPNWVAVLVPHNVTRFPDWLSKHCVTPKTMDRVLGFLKGAVKAHTSGRTKHAKSGEEVIRILELVWWLCPEWKNKLSEFDDVFALSAWVVEHRTELMVIAEQRADSGLLKQAEEWVTDTFVSLPQPA